MCRELTPWEKSLDFHGHSCPGLAIGYRAAMAAMEHFSQGRSEDEEMVAIVETDACGVDAVQVITGCTFGKGNLIYRDLGKQVFSFGVRGKNEGLRTALKYGVMENMAPEGWSELRNRVFNGEAGEEEQKRFRELHRQFSEQLAEVPLEEIMDIQVVELELPPKARIHETVLCSCCGEGVMKTRAGENADGYVCGDCG